MRSTITAISCFAGPAPVRCPPCPAAPASIRPASSPPEVGKHHVMVRGIERRAIFQDDRDRADFVAQARGAVSAVAMLLFGLPATRVASALGITQMAVLRGIARGLDSERLAREVLR